MRSLKRKLTTMITFTVLVLGTLSPGCSDQKSKSSDAPQYTEVRAVSKKTYTRLFYKGSLAPIRSTPVLCPVDGFVTKILFKYGEEVKAGQLLLTIKATGLATKYRQAVSDFLQKKAALETQTSTYEGDKELYKAGVMSRVDFDNARNTFATSVLNLSQSRISLEKILKQADVRFKSVEGLKLSQAKQVIKILERTFANISIHSPSKGVVLIPVEVKSSSGESKSNALVSGSPVKAQQSVLALGDPTGYRVKFQVSEINIVQMKAGLKAEVSGDSFPGIKLKGYVKQVAVQADPNQSGGGSGVSMFKVVVNVPNVSAIDRKNIRIGMSAKVEIEIERPAKIMVPINAVFTKGGTTYVTVIDPKTKSRKNVRVLTGETSLTEVVIIDGLKAGEKVIVRKVSSDAKTD